MPRPADREPLVLDACGVLNLAAAIPLTTAATQLSRRLVVAAPAAAEALFLEDEEDGIAVRTPVDLDGLEVVDLDEPDLATYVELAVQLDDGEAATLAFAQAQAWPVWTDDRKALRVAAAMSPPVEVISTAAIFREWADRRGLSDAEAGRALRRVEARATFAPRSTDTNFTWWSRCRQSSNE